MKKYNFAIVGATGLVGRTFIKVLEEYDLPLNSLRLFASAKSAGKKMVFKGQEYIVEDLNNNSFEGIDFALFSAGASVSKQWAPEFEKVGAIVVDNSSCWRMDDSCALIVPEINIDDYLVKRKIIANPNCSTIQSVLPLKPLMDKYGLKRVVYTTYQACSGSGQKGVDDLARCKAGEANQFYPYDISKTCIPEIDVALENDYTKEEMKMVNETHKILHNDKIKVAATCIRVPVEKAHGVVIAAEFDKPVDVNEAREVMRNYEGIVIVDDLKNHIYPVSTIAAGNDMVYVGRLRKDLSCDNGLIFYCVADNIRKGAAANAVQIVKKIIDKENNI